MSRLARFIYESKPTLEITVVSDFNDFYCPLCNSPTFLETGLGVPICNTCGWINHSYVDVTPDWKTVKQQQEDLIATSVLSLTKSPSSSSSSSTGTISTSSSSSSSVASYACSATIATTTLSSYIEKQIKDRDSKLASSSNSDFFTKVSSSSKPPRRKKVRFQEQQSKRTSTTSSFKPSINDRTFYDHCQHIAQVCANYRILRVILDRSVWWYKELLQFYKFHGFLCDALKAASLYIASLEYKYPITQKDCADMFGVAKTYTTKCINLMEKHRNIIIHGTIDHLPEKVQQSRQLFMASVKAPTVTQECHKPADYLRLFMSRLSKEPTVSWSMQQTMLSFFIAKKVDELHLATDNYPHCVAATILFLVSSCTEENKNNVLNKKRICEISQTSEVTLNRCYNKLYAYKHIIVPVNILKSP